MAPKRRVAYLCVVKVYTEENIRVDFVESNPSCKLAASVNVSAMLTALHRERDLLTVDAPTGKAGWRGRGTPPHLRFWQIPSALPFHLYVLLP